MVDFDTLNRSFPDTALAAKRAELKVNEPTKKLPEFFTGARCRIRVNGKLIGAALEVSWSVNAEMEEVRTIDSYMPWEIVPGQVSVSARLQRVVDPRRQLGSDGLYSTITSYLHQPYASIEVADRMGQLIFTARGMFKDLQGSVRNREIGVESVTFVGYYWRENVNQDFSPVKLSISDQLENRFTKNSVLRPALSALGV